MRRIAVFMSSLVLLFLSFENLSFAQSSQPTTCISSRFDTSGTSYWHNVSLTLTNNCSLPMDFQSSSITFQTQTALNTSYWVYSSPLSYPDSNTVIRSQSVSTGGYLAVINLHFPTQSWANTVLQVGQSIVLQYGTAYASQIASTAKVYLQSAPVTGSLTLANTSLQPSGVSQTYARIHLQANAQDVSVISLPWNTAQTFTGIAAGTYTLVADSVSDGAGNTYVGTVSPASVVISSSQTAQSNISYSLAPKSQVSLQVSGAPAALNGLTISLSPSDNSGVVQATVPLVNGAGSTQVALTTGVSYTLSASVPGYSISFSPQPVVAASNASAQITLSQIPTPPPSAGRMIGYLPGWKTPPDPTALASAGYTHILVAFGVFSTSNPGQIVSAFDTVTKTYIQQLHSAGIKVLLSLGGAITSIANTSVDFHQVLSLASSPTAFTNAFLQSLASFQANYGFDGFDIDIEHGINAGGTFTTPTGDIAALANIINTFHAQNPSALITLAPQVANISATSGFDATWGNYASLIMQTYSSLAWVGIQLYNAGCAYGIDKVCYDPNQTSSPNFSVAMATDLLANWPAKLANGQISGFQPYISYLSPSQVVIGYPSPNASGASDGSPVTPTSTIKRAIQCLQTATASSSSCDTYVPPKAYGLIGGVFNWEVTYDQDNNFQFAKSLKACALTGACTF